MKIRKAFVAIRAWHWIPWDYINIQGYTLFSLVSHTTKFIQTGWIYILWPFQTDIVWCRLTRKIVGNNTVPFLVPLRPFWTYKSPSHQCLSRINQIREWRLSAYNDCNRFSWYSVSFRIVQERSDVWGGVFTNTDTSGILVSQLEVWFNRLFHNAGVRYKYISCNVFVSQVPEIGSSRGNLFSLEKDRTVESTLGTRICYDILWMDT